MHVIESVTGDRHDIKGCRALGVTSKRIIRYRLVCGVVDLVCDSLCSFCCGPKFTRDETVSVAIQAIRSTTELRRQI